MDRDVEELLELLRKMLQDAFTIPLGNDRCVVDKDKALGLIDEITASLPSYIKDAKRIADDEANIVARAKKDAEAMRRAAEEHARKQVSEQEILIHAKQKASELVHNAEVKSKEVRTATNDYVDNALKRTEEALLSAMNEVRQSRSEFRSATKK